MSKSRILVFSRWFQAGLDADTETKSQMKSIYQSQTEGFLRTVGFVKNVVKCNVVLDMQRYENFD